MWKLVLFLGLLLCIFHTTHCKKHHKKKKRNEGIQANRKYTTYNEIQKKINLIMLESMMGKLTHKKHAINKQTNLKRKSSITPQADHNVIILKKNLFSKAHFRNSDETGTKRLNIIKPKLDLKFIGEKKHAVSVHYDTTNDEEIIEVVLDRTKSHHSNGTDETKLFTTKLANILNEDNYGKTVREDEEGYKNMKKSNNDNKIITVIDQNNNNIKNMKSIKTKQKPNVASASNKLSDTITEKSKENNFLLSHNLKEINDTFNDDVSASNRWGDHSPPRSSTLKTALNLPNRKEHDINLPNEKNIDAKKILNPPGFDITQLKETDESLYPVESPVKINNVNSKITNSLMDGESRNFDIDSVDSNENSKPFNANKNDNPADKVSKTTAKVNTPSIEHSLLLNTSSYALPDKSTFLIIPQKSPNGQFNGPLSEERNSPTIKGGKDADSTLDEIKPQELSNLHRLQEPLPLIKPLEASGSKIKSLAIQQNNAKPTIFTGEPNIQQYVPAIQEDTISALANLNAKQNDISSGTEKSVEQTDNNKPIETTSPLMQISRYTSPQSQQINVIKQPLLPVLIPSDQYMSLVNSQISGKGNTSSLNGISNSMLNTEVNDKTSSVKNNDTDGLSPDGISKNMTVETALKTLLSVPNLSIQIESPKGVKNNTKTTNIKLLSTIKRRKNKKMKTKKKKKKKNTKKSDQKETMAHLQSIGFESGDLSKPRPVLIKSWTKKMVTGSRRHGDISPTSGPHIINELTQSTLATTNNKTKSSFTPRIPVQTSTTASITKYGKQIETQSQETGERRQQDHGFIPPPSIDMHESHPFQNEVPKHSEQSQPVSHEKETDMKFVNPDKAMGTNNMLFSNGKGEKQNFVQGFEDKSNNMKDKTTYNENKNKKEGEEEGEEGKNNKVHDVKEKEETKHKERKQNRRDDSESTDNNEIMNEINNAKGYQYGHGFQHVDNSMVENGETSVEEEYNPLDIAKSIAGFGINDYRYGESWFEGQRKPIIQKHHGDHNENHDNDNENEINEEDASDKSDSNEGHISNPHDVDMHGFEADAEEEEAGHSRTTQKHINLADIKTLATKGQLKLRNRLKDKSHQALEGEKLKKYLDRKTQNIMQKICKKAECHSSDGRKLNDPPETISPETDDNNNDDDSKLEQFVHGGDEIVAQVSIGAPSKDITTPTKQIPTPKKDVTAMKDTITVNKPLMKLAARFLKQSNSKEKVNLEENKEVTADQRQVKPHCECVSFIKVLKTPGCMDYCKASLLPENRKAPTIITNAQHVESHVDDRGHPLLYDKTSGDLIPQNPLLDLNANHHTAVDALDMVDSKALSHEFINNLQVDKSVLEDVKNDAKNDHGLSEIFKNHLKALADSFTKEKINQILSEPVSKVLALANHHELVAVPIASERQVSLGSENSHLKSPVSTTTMDSHLESSPVSMTTLDSHLESHDSIIPADSHGEAHVSFTPADSDKHITPIHIDENASPELVAQLLHSTHESHTGPKLDIASLNKLLHHSGPEIVADDGGITTHEGLEENRASDSISTHSTGHLSHHNEYLDEDMDDDDPISKEMLERLLHRHHHGRHRRYHHHHHHITDHDIDHDTEPIVIHEGEHDMDSEHDTHTYIDGVSQGLHGTDDDGDDEYVSDDDDEHMMFADHDDDELHSRERTHHHLLEPQAMHFGEHQHHHRSLNLTGPCKNDGVFVPVAKGKSQCMCKHQFYGRTCKDWNYCYPNPCENGGQCELTSEIPMYKCACRRAYMGLTCTDFNPCDPNPCSSHGACSHDGKTATCTCSPRFKGENCAELNNCYPNPCKNGGECMDKDGIFKCKCKNGYIGKTCSETSPCFSNPCLNGASCIENATSYNCICERGYIGRNCKDKLCNPNPCKNSGTCMQKEHSAFVCLCPPWAGGDTCEDISPCRMNPCKNNARCIDVMSGFRWTLKSMQYFCDCKPPFKGAHCDKNSCSACHRNAHCEIDRCVCDRVFYGNGIQCKSSD